MKNFNQWVIAAVLIVPSLQLAGCSSEDGHHKFIAPAHLEKVAGSDLKRVILTSKAIERTGLETTPVQAAEAMVVAVSEGAEASPTPKTSVPYSALFYDYNGGTWVYVNPEGRTFVRHPVKIDRVQGDEAILSAGPSVDTKVVKVGVAELYGVEIGMGGAH